MCRGDEESKRVGNAEVRLAMALEYGRNDSGEGVSPLGHLPDPACQRGSLIQT